MSEIKNKTLYPITITGNVLIDGSQINIEANSSKNFNTELHDGSRHTFNMKIGSVSELELFLQESNSAREITIASANGWLMTKSDNPYIFTLILTDESIEVKLDITHAAHLEIKPHTFPVGIAIVGTVSTITRP